MVPTLDRANHINLWTPHVGARIGPAERARVRHAISMAVHAAAAHA
jgi:hypothetical protein